MEKVLTTPIWYNGNRGMPHKEGNMNGKRIAPKTIVLYVLNIIKLYSAKEHPVSQTAICNYLNEIGVPCDRKTVGRNVAYLQEFGYPIVHIPVKGYYLDWEAMKTVRQKWIL